MNAITRRIAAVTAMAAAPALIALGTAAAGHADSAAPTETTTGPSISQPAHPSTAVPWTPPRHRHSQNPFGKL